MKSMSVAFIFFIAILLVVHQYLPQFSNRDSDKRLNW